jgi:ribose transport system ATP-binding protein
VAHARVSRSGEPAALEAAGISKRFRSVRALDGAAVSVAAGELHGLVGENGSGKSTLIRVLSGYYRPEPGARLTVHGRPVRIPAEPVELRALGVAFVHQDGGLLPELSVAENLFVGELATEASWRLSRRRLRQRAGPLLSRLELEVDPGAAAGGLDATARTLVSVARALGELEAAPRAGVLVLDEVTAALPANRRARLLALLEQLAADGVGVLLVSHDLDEVLAATARVTVLRGGRTVAELDTAGLDRGRLLELVVGSHAPPARRERPPVPEGEAVRIHDLFGARVDGLSLEVRPGEVVGLTGADGSGFEDVPYLVYGLRRGRGRLRVDGREHDLAAMRPHRAVAARIALAPGDRRDGCVEWLRAGENVTLPLLGSFGPLRLRRRALTAAAASLLEEHDVRPPDPRLAFGALSGGNQQKALLAKAASARPALLLLDQPTRGVDAGASDRIVESIRRQAAGGGAVLCASPDAEELARLSDRVLVVAGGRIARELAGEDVTPERIAAARQERPGP